MFRFHLDLVDPLGGAQAIPHHYETLTSVIIPVAIW